MADIPLFPDESNMARFQDFVNIQKELSEHLLEQQHLYEKIGRINRDIEDRVIKRRQSEFRMLKLIQEQNVKYNELVAKRGTYTGQAAKDLESDIASTLQLIEYNRKLVDLSKLASSVEMEMAKKAYDEDRKWFKFASEQFQNVTGFRVQEFEMVKSTGEQMLKLGGITEGVAYTVSAIVMMLKGAFELFKKLDTSAWHFRKAMGMTRGESAVIRRNVEKSAIALMHIGVSADSLYASYQALGKAVGGVHNVTASTAEEVAIMAAQLGIAADVSVGFMRNLAAVSKSSLESQVSMMYIAKSMSNAAGVQLDEVMSDVAKATGPTLVMMSRLPNLALRSSIELRRMGSSLAEASKSSRHILDFTESVNEEMEASVLLGRSINLQRARELAYRRDLEGSTKEILRITKDVSFESLDVFQQEAFARATGKSVDELLRMLQTDKQLAKIRRSGTPEQKEQLALYEKMRSENEKAARERAKDAGAMIRQMANQERITAITAKWNQILAKAQQWLLPIIDNLLAMVIPAMDIAQGLFAWAGALKLISPLMVGVGSLFGRAILYFQEVQSYGLKMTNVFQKMWYFVGKIAWHISEWGTQGKKAFMSLSWIAKIRSWFSPLSIVGKVVGQIGGWFAKIGTWIGNILAPIGKIFGFVGKGAGFIGFFGKWIPILGWVITAFQFIGNLIARMKGIGDAFNKGFLHGLWFGLKAIGGALYDTLIQPFVSAFKWIMNFFGGKSPSKIAIAILKGIVSIQFKLLGVLLNPWKTLFSVIFQLIPSFGKIVGAVGNAVRSTMLSILNAVKNMGSKVYEFVVSPFKRALGWVTDKFGQIGQFIGKLFSKSDTVEKRATAAYIPAVTVSPKATEVASFKKTPVEGGKEGEKASTAMSDETGQRMVALLEKILAKDSNIKMDGQLLSTHLARQTEFRGGYGVNKVA